ncbi:alpha/beta hydrolase [Nocardia sp. NPDC059246]|uniref:alpha/beta hydrolase n=1 Tax=unclassified Nocardia TaxID=2637762 RepID=UPI003689AAE8
MMVAAAVACGAAPATAQPSDEAPGGTPAAVWTPCPDHPDFECTTVPAPLDHQHPDRRTIELAVIRHRATDPAHRIGSLLFNPGGPAGAGTTVLPIAYPLFPLQIQERFDIVSWDPRGVGESTSVQCFDDKAEFDAWFAQLPVGFPVGHEQEQRWIDLYAELGRGCERRDPALLRFVSTTDSAYDIDLLRRVLGEQLVTYFGVSYGTLLGATYANLFPDRVRAMVLDGNIDPSAWYDWNPVLSTFLRQASDLGTAKTLEQFLNLCSQAGPIRCPFSAGSAVATRAKYEALLHRLLIHPQDGFTYAATANAVRANLYTVHATAGSPANWTALAELLQQLWLGATPQMPDPGENRLVDRSSTALSDSSREGSAQQQKYTGVEQPLAIICGESPNPRDPHSYGAMAKFSTVRAGTVGPFWAWVTEACSTWPAKAAHRYTGPWGRSATPILTVNAIYDPATPYHNALAMTAQLHNARLLTVAGYGHTTLFNPSSCAKAYESDYVIRGALPPPGTVCQQDVPPFT